jgi:hypothetical protein
MGSADIVLVHEMPGTIPDAMNISYASLIIIVILDHGGSLESTRKLFICPFLSSSLINLVIIVIRSWSSQAMRSLLLLRLFRHLHMIQAIGFHSFVIEPWTVARFPLQTAYHTKLCCTTT